MSEPATLLDRLFAPRWIGAWPVFRVLFVLAAALTHGPRLLAIEDAYAATDLVIARSPVPLAEVWILSPSSATAAWTLGMLGLAAVLWGGRLARPGLLAFLLGSWLLLAAEGAKIKAYDRLLSFQALALLVGPSHERCATSKWRSNAGYLMLIVVYMSLYGGTGLAKLVEPTGGWFDGTAMATNLVDMGFGGRPLGAVLSGWPGLMQVLGVATVAFELGFPVLLLWRRANPWLLLLGVAFHLGIVLTLDVDSFSLVAVAAYPALLHPELAREAWTSWRASRPLRDR